MAKDAGGSHPNRRLASQGDASADRARQGLAVLIIWVSVILIAVFAGVAIWMAWEDKPTQNGKSAAEVAQGVLNGLLPIASAWVGAVLAYFFVNQATEDANRTTLQVLKRRTFADTVRAVPIMAAIRTMPQMEYVYIEHDSSTGAATTRISDLLEIFDAKGRTRAPIFEWREADKAFVLRYILHESTVFDFLRRNPAVDPKTVSLSALIDDPASRLRWDRSIAYVSQTATLADAKAAMETDKRIQDVVVTLNGRPDEPFIGWLTNVDVLRNCVAGATSLDQD